MTPNEIDLREWSGDTVKDLASAAVDSVKGVWYDITVAWDGAELTVSRGLSGGALTVLFTAETTLENDSTDIGFGVGEKAEYRFDEVRLSSPSLSAEEPSKLTEYTYDALGRRVAMTDYTGAFARTTRYLYAGVSPSCGPVATEYDLGGSGTRRLVRDAKATIRWLWRHCGLIDCGRGIVCRSDRAWRKGTVWWGESVEDSTLMGLPLRGLKWWAIQDSNL